MAGIINAGRTLTTKPILPLAPDPEASNDPAINPAARGATPLPKPGAPSLPGGAPVNEGTPVPKTPGPGDPGDDGAIPVPKIPGPPAPGAPAAGEPGPGTDAGTPGPTDYTQPLGGPGSVAGPAGIINGARGDSTLAWNPTAGIVDQIRGIKPEDVTTTGYRTAEVPLSQEAGATGYQGAGYSAERAPDAQGFEATGYTPETAQAAQLKENVSEATNRIVGQDSELLQREQARADQQSNARGLINSSMAVQAGRAAVLDKAAELAAGDVEAGKFNVDQLNTMQRFNADTKNSAAAFLANAKNASAEFLAAAKNQNGMFNADQANSAAAFSANAANQASSLLAAAKNTAAMFNAGEANKSALFAVEQANRASEFAAAAENAARSQNATAHNEAMQRYTDAMNAAIAAQNDAENMARRDTAQITAEKAMNTERVRGQIAAAGASASATVQAAKIHADSAASLQANSLAAQRDMQAKDIEAANNRFGLQLSQQESQFARSLSSSQFNEYQRGLTALQLNDMEPDARQNALHNYNSVWLASGKLPFDIDISKFPPATGA